jgi:hypothetical protein
MSTTAYISAIIIIMLTTSPGVVQSLENPGEAGFPSQNILFKMERNKDKDVIYYEIVVNSDGRLNTTEPIRVFWVRKSQNNKVEPLTRVQRNYSYGLKFLETTPNRARFQFMASDERTFIVQKNHQGEFRVFTQSNNKLMELQKIFVHFNGGTFWVPIIQRIDIHLKDSRSLQTIVEAFNPR